MGMLSDRCSGRLGGGTDESLFSAPMASPASACSAEEENRFRTEKRNEAEEGVDWGADANCPFCGSPANETAIDVITDRSTGKMELSGYYVVCLWGQCGAFGPNRPTAQEAVDAWNQRQNDQSEARDE